MPSALLEKLKLVDDRLAAGPEPVSGFLLDDVPDPEKITVCLPGVALSVRVNVVARMPTAEGLNLT